jgi:flagellin
VIIHTNTNAAVATAALVGSERKLDAAVKHLSTGSRIYSASDDASGLAISTRLTSQIRELDMSITAAADAIGMVSIIDGALEGVGNMYQRLRELALQAPTGTNSDADLRMLQNEFDQIVLGIESIITNTTYNNLNVFFNPDGVVPGATGWRNDGQAVVIDLNFNLGTAGPISTTFTPDAPPYSFVDSEVLSGWGNFFYMQGDTNGDLGSFRGESAGSMYSNHVLDTGHANHRSNVSIGAAKSTVENIDDLLTNVMSSRAKLGATHNRLTHAIDSMTTRAIETRASRSQILDTDYAVTTSSLAKAKILHQASMAMLAQANSAPGMVMMLLQPD